MRPCLAVLPFIGFQLAALPATANDRQSQDISLSASTPMPDGQRVTAPFEFLKLCDSHPRECEGASAQAEKKPFTEHTIEELYQVNVAVNNEIQPRRDSPSNDEWELAPEQGDCEDYAITKRSRLLQKGWPASDLRLAIVSASFGPHMVLVVSTPSGAYVLDSRTEELHPWNATEYRFVSQQSRDDPRVWVASAEDDQG